MADVAKRIGHQPNSELAAEQDDRVIEALANPDEPEARDVLLCALEGIGGQLTKDATLRPTGTAS